MNKEFINNLLSAFNTLSNYLSNEDLSIDAINSYFDYFTGLLGVKVDYSSLNNQKKLDRNDLLWYCGRLLELLSEANLSDEQRCAIYICSLLANNRTIASWLDSSEIIRQMKDDNNFKKILYYFLESEMDFDKIDHIKDDILLCIKIKYRNDDYENISKRFKEEFEGEQKYQDIKYKSIEKKKQLEQKKIDDYNNEQKAIYNDCLNFCEGYLDYKYVSEGGIGYLYTNIKKIDDEYKRYLVLKKFLFNRIYGIYNKMNLYSSDEILSVINDDIFEALTLEYTIGNNEYRKKIIDEFYSSRKDIINLLSDKGIRDNLLDTLDDHVAKLKQIIIDSETPKIILECDKASKMKIVDVLYINSFSKMLEEEKDDNKKYDIVKRFLSNRFQFLYSLGKIDFNKLEEYFYNDTSYLYLLINQISDFSLKMSLIEYFYDTRSRIIKSKVGNDEEKDVLYRIIKNEKYSFDVSSYPLEYIKYLHSRNELADLKKSFNWNNFYNKYSDIIVSNIDLFLENYNISNISTAKNYLEEMSKFDEEIYRVINFSLLDSKYIEVFTPYQMCILIHHRFQEELPNFSDNCFKFIKKVFEKQQFSNDFSDYLKYLSYNLSKYISLIDKIDIDSLSNEKMLSIMKLITFDNVMKIESLDEIDNLDTIYLERFREAYKIDDALATDTMRDLICLKKYGLEFRYLKKIISLSSIDNDDYELKEASDYFGYLARINGRDELLAEFSNIPFTHQLVDKILYERYYRFKLEEEYNRKLFNPEKGKKVVEGGITFYEPEDEFFILMTAKSPYKDKDSNLDLSSLKDDWNRRDVGSNFFCASVMSDNMLGCCEGLNSIYYGFNEIKSDSLIAMGPSDIQSTSAGFDASTATSSTYYGPEDLVKNTGNHFVRFDLYNELDIRRYSDGVKTQPDYIIYFKKEGESSIARSNAIEASKAFGNIPIVMIDVDKYIKRGIEAINKATAEYNNNPTIDNLIKVWELFYMNSISYMRWNKEWDAESREEWLFDRKVDLPDIIRKNLDQIDSGFKRNRYELKIDLKSLEQDLEEKKVVA